MNLRVSQRGSADDDDVRRYMGACLCDGLSDVTSSVCSMRAEKFHALARLFDLDITLYRDSIQQLMQRCDGVARCAMETTPLRDQGVAALAWVDNVFNQGSVEAEHRRLFGAADPRRGMPAVSPVGAVYASTAEGEIVSRVERCYASRGFVPLSIGGRSCPTHIANELDFMGHCLRAAVAGDAECERVAYEFVVDHLSLWGILFSAAVYSLAGHPVTRFAGLALEHLLLCETERASMCYTRENA